MEAIWDIPDLKAVVVVVVVVIRNYRKYYPYYAYISLNLLAEYGEERVVYQSMVPCWVLWDRRE